MSHRKPKGHAKTFQQLQTERRHRQREAEQERAIVEDTASKFSCSNGVARDFAGQCEKRLVDLDFDLLCSQLALDSWASPPERARPVVDILRELADERQRHRDAIARLRERLLDFTRSEPCTTTWTARSSTTDSRCANDSFPIRYRRPVQNYAESGDCRHYQRFADGVAPACA